MDQTEKSSVKYNQLTDHGHRLNRSMNVRFDIQHGRLHSFPPKCKKKKKKKKKKESVIFPLILVP